jgi:ubiquinone/menaquinone biosynthesis C-methylase UbiE
MKEKDYREDADRKHSSGEWTSPNPDIPSPIALGPCGYTAILLLRRILGLKGGLLLDVGGGDGGFSERLIKDRGDITPVLMDISHKPLAGFRGYAVQGNSVDLPFRDETFDIVLSSDHLEHIYYFDILTSLIEMNRVLNSGGKLLVHSSSFGYYLRRLGAKYGKNARLDKFDLKDGHFSRPTPSEWFELVKKSGFKIKRFYFYKHFFQPILRRIKDTFIRGDDKTSVGKSRNALKSNPVMKTIAFGMVLVSLIDIFLFSKIPGGAVILELEKKS